MNLADIATRALRRADPETAHRLAILGLKAGFGPRDREADDPILAVRLSGLSLGNCIGLAAGFDKNAEAADAMLSAGFGFVECGTVTPRPQVGNPRPRLFRLIEDGAVINRMGFNNDGLERFAGRLAARERRGVLGANLGANKDSEDRVGDYVTGLKRLEGLCDYFTVNISSPNTPGLRALQSRDALHDLLGRVAEARTGPAPVFLKVAPDLADAEVEDIARAVVGHGLDGVIVANTTIARPTDLTARDKGEAGGLSGRPLFIPSTEMLRRFRTADPTLLLIGCGGIGSGRDAYEKILAGARAVQLYSALVYEGPGLIRRIKRDVAERLRADGWASASAACGAG